VHEEFTKFWKLVKARCCSSTPDVEHEDAKMIG